jgi:hypothetical protein
MNSKISAAELLKNKNSLARIRAERVVKNIITRRTNMTKAGERPKTSMLTFKKNKTNKSNSNNKPKSSGINNKSNSNKSNKNLLVKSMHAYKHQLALPFAKTGLHNPKSPGYHDELVQNMKNMSNSRKNIMPMHNKTWFVDQLKRNVWALRNNRPVSPVTAVPRCGGAAASSSTVMKTGSSKTKKLLLNRKGAKAAKPKAVSSKKLLNQLKSIKPVK